LRGKRKLPSGKPSGRRKLTKRARSEGRQSEVKGWLSVRLTNRFADPRRSERKFEGSAREN
jgi:hypothetical protein